MLIITLFPLFFFSSSSYQMNKRGPPHSIKYVNACYFAYCFCCFPIYRLYVSIVGQPQLLIDRHRSRVALCGMSNEMPGAAERHMRTQMSDSTGPHGSAPPYRSSISATAAFPKPIIDPEFSTPGPKKSCEPTSGGLAQANVEQRASLTMMTPIATAMPISPVDGPNGPSGRFARFFQGSPKTSTTVVHSDQSPPLPEIRKCNR